ncbi:MAG: penicillin binding protein PBP4B [Lachnospiraceae bacterium]|nr:penicillin binding protein PBP4B [Lachnospiraceae bacterium]
MNIKEKLIAVNMRQLKWNRKRILAWVLAVVLCGAACGPKTEEPEAPTQEEYVEPTFVGERVAALPAGQWQEEAAFPDRKGYVDDTLAMNGMLSFAGYQGQGTLFLAVAEGTASFQLFINEKQVDMSEFAGGGLYRLDYAKAARNGRNTLQVSGIEPFSTEQAVTVYVPYPEVLSGMPKEAGIAPEALELLSALIASDVAHGFTSAQLAVIRNGVLVYENAWGKTNSYEQDGRVKTDSPAVTTDTLYDLASLTKMFAVNYALQKLVTDGALDMDAKITEFLGQAFVDQTVDRAGNPASARQKEWKASITVRDLLCHQGGLPIDPRSVRYSLLIPKDTPEETRAATVRAICETLPEYEPGTKTVYSDMDYMILGLVVEQVTGQDLDTYLKETFYKPMGLTHITYNPLQNGFIRDDCAATELNGNTRDGAVSFPGIRTETIQGEVHDEKAYYSMGGVAGHAGLFANASDLAKLSTLMLTGGYGTHRYFSQNVIDQFTAPKKEDAANWGLGWWREGDDQRTWYFGSQAGSGTIGHQGWTGTLVMIDPERDLVVVYLTNKINSPVSDPAGNPNKFDGSYYTAATLGFVPQILSIGMDSEEDVYDQLLALLAEMTGDSMRLVPAAYVDDANHPAVRNVESKLAVLRLWEDKRRETEDVSQADVEPGPIAAKYIARWQQYRAHAQEYEQGDPDDREQREDDLP